GRAQHGNLLPGHGRYDTDRYVRWPILYFRLSRARRCAARVRRRLQLYGWSYRYRGAATPSHRSAVGQLVERRSRGALSAFVQRADLSEKPLSGSCSNEARGVSSRSYRQTNRAHDRARHLEEIFVRLNDPQSEIRFESKPARAMARRAEASTFSLSTCLA